MLDIEIPELDARDRCDWPHCGAQARAVIWFAPERILTFCRHHTEENETAIRTQAWFIDKQYDALYAVKTREDLLDEPDDDEWDDGF